MGREFMQSVMKVGEVRETMMAFSKEMSKVGLEWSLLLHLNYVLLHRVYLLKKLNTQVCFHSGGRPGQDRQGGWVGP